jgi:hypothetical protein
LETIKASPKLKRTGFPLRRPSPVPLGRVVEEVVVEEVVVEEVVVEEVVVEEEMDWAVEYLNLPKDRQPFSIYCYS